MFESVSRINDFEKIDFLKLPYLKSQFSNLSNMIHRNGVILKMIEIILVGSESLLTHLEREEVYESSTTERKKKGIELNHRVYLFIYLFSNTK